jgi:hypothetical protein
MTIEIPRIALNNGAELVVGEQAVSDQADAEHDRNDRRGGVVGELEDPRCRDGATPTM